MNRLQQFLEQVIVRAGEYEFTVLNLLLIFAVVLAVWILRWAVREGMRTIYENFNLSKENKLTIKRFLNYIISFFAILMVIRVIGIHPIDDILNFELFKERMNGVLINIPEIERTKQDHFDIYLKFDEISKKLVKELDLMEPFGMGNQRPTFRMTDAKLESFTILKDVHVKTNWKLS